MMVAPYENLKLLSNIMDGEANSRATIASKLVAIGMMNGNATIFLEHL